MLLESLGLLQLLGSIMHSLVVDLVEGTEHSSVLDLMLGVAGVFVEDLSGVEIRGRFGLRLSPKLDKRIISTLNLLLHHVNDIAWITFGQSRNSHWLSTHTYLKAVGIVAFFFLHTSLFLSLALFSNLFLLKFCLLLLFCF